MEITLTVNHDKYMYATPDKIGYEGDHNWSSFKIIQLEEFDQYVCIAILKTANGEELQYTVTDGNLPITNDLTIEGELLIQLQYTQAVTGETIGFTNIVSLQVGPSLKAYDYGSGGTPDILTQLQVKVDGLAKTVADLQEQVSNLESPTVTPSGRPAIASVYAISDVIVGFTDASNIHFGGGSILCIVSRDLMKRLTLSQIDVTFSYDSIITLNIESQEVKVISKFKDFTLADGEYIVGNMYLNNTVPTVAIYGTSGFNYDIRYDDLERRLKAVEDYLSENS